MRVSIPHDLGREEVRRRMKERIGDLGAQMPGQVADISHSWASEDRMDLDIGVMGQKVTGHIDIEDSLVWVDVTLPAMLSFFEPVVQNAIRQHGETLLEDKRKD